MDAKRLEVSEGTETSYDVVPSFGKSAAGTACNTPRGNEEH
jgi:hypothetical protein